MKRAELFPEAGKVSARMFNEVILPRLGASDDSVLVGPCNGVDVGVVRLGGGKVMVCTTDPFFVVPAYGWKRAAWFAVHILASDAATSGLRPRYMSVDLNLPMSMNEDEFEALWSAVSDECARLGIAIVTGHTGRYSGCNYPMIGGATMFSVGDEGSFVTPKNARPGDRIIITKGAAIEATGLFAATFREYVSKVFGTAFADKAEAFFWKMSVVEEALAAAEFGVGTEGVTAMHDATECGVVGGVFELAQASGNGVRLFLDQVPLPEECRLLCGHFGIDPYTSISEGTLLLTCAAGAVSGLLEIFARKQIPAAVAGEILKPGSGRWLVRDGREEELTHPETDPFWQAFDKAAAQIAAAGRE